MPFFRSNSSAASTASAETRSPPSTRSSKTSLLSRFSHKTKAASIAGLASAISTPPDSIADRGEERARALAKLTRSEAGSSNDNLAITATDMQASTYSLTDSDATSVASASTVVMPLRQQHHRRTGSRIIVKENQLFLARTMITELLGAVNLQRTSLGAPATAIEQHPSARTLFVALWDGVLLCRLLKRLVPDCSIVADHRDLPSARKANVARFLQTVQSRFHLHPDDLFQSDDLFGGTEEGFAAVVHCLAHLWLHISNDKSNTRAARHSADPRLRTARTNHISFAEGTPDGTRRSQSLYGLDRRLSESAIDVMNPLPEWDEQKQATTPVYTGDGAERDSSSSSDDQSPIAQYATAYQSVDRPRRPPRSNLRPSQGLSRVVSAPSRVDTALASEAIPLKNGRPLSATSVSSVPFPSSPERSTRYDSAHAKASPLRPRHNRWNSEVQQQPQTDSIRSEGQRFSSSSGLAKRSSSQPRSKPKIVVRDATGRPTYVYQLGEVIGRGQFGVVYRALNLLTGAVVAVKRIRLAGKSEAEISELATEVELLKKCLHPSVVRYEGLVRTEHYLNLILEFVENGSLLDTIKAFGEFPESLVASYVQKILEGLHYLHTNQVVHCDLKCANILTTKSGNVKIGDFGVSLNLNAVHNSPEISGTPCWIAPEVILLQGASTASDIWSLGCTIIEMISGKPPYAELMSMTAMFRIVEDDMPPIPPTCSPELYEFLTLCFAKDPQARPSASELFEHTWLKNHWDPTKEFRPQDSIPFLKRISTEIRRLDLSSSAPASASPLMDSLGLPSITHSAPRRSSYEPPLARRGMSLDMTEDAVEALRTDLAVEGANPQSLLVRPIPLIRGTSGISSNTNGSSGIQRAHTFVKTSFAKSLECKICRSSIKRHGKAFLCEACGLICHTSCSEFAVTVCDLRASLLRYSTDDFTQSTPELATPPSFKSSFLGKPKPILLSHVSPAGPPLPAEAPLTRDMSSDSSSSGSTSGPVMFSPGLCSNISLATTVAADPVTLIESLPKVGQSPFGILPRLRSSSRLKKRKSASSSGERECIVS